MVSGSSERAMVFGRSAAEYHRWRPTYPDDAVEWVLPPGACRVADLGAGTGKLTGSLLSRGLRVEAIEPDLRMLTELHRQYPTAVVHHRTADHLPFADASMDAVLAADAWHWFPFDATVPEVRRVLRLGGWLGLLWNGMTPIEPWEHELAQLDPDYQPSSPTSPSDHGPFPADETQTATFPWAWEASPAQWCSYLQTQSAFVVMDHTQRDARLHEAQKIVAGACARTGRTTVPVHHEVFCARWRPGRTEV